MLQPIAEFPHLNVFCIARLSPILLLTMTTVRWKASARAHKTETIYTPLNAATDDSGSPHVLFCWLRRWGAR